MINQMMLAMFALFLQNISYSQHIFDRAEVWEFHFDCLNEISSSQRRDKKTLHVDFWLIHVILV